MGWCDRRVIDTLHVAANNLEEVGTLKGRSGPVVELVEILDRLPLFSTLDESARDTLASACRLVRLEKGQVLFCQSDPAEAAYVVRSGSISIVLDSPDGRELVIDEMRAGDIFGEAGLLTKTSHSGGAIARQSSQLLVIPRDALLLALDQDPGLTRRLLEITAHRLQRSAARELALAFMDAQARLARHLLLLEEQEREAGYVTASQEDLARSTGLIRQTVAKALGYWRRQGWLLTGRGRILILNRKALEGLERAVLIPE